MRHLKALLFPLLLLVLENGISQEIAMLDNLRSFTSQDTFIANNIYKVVGLNFSENSELNVLVEGDISKLDFSFTLISIIPALQKQKSTNNLEFLYSNLNANNVKEALVMEAVRALYPEYFYDYLLTRAECLFEVPWRSVSSQMNFDIDQISKYIEVGSFIRKVKKKFSRNPETKAKFSVNKIEFTLLREFYLNINDASISNYFPNQDECDYVYCLAEVMNRKIQNNFKSGDLWEVDVKKNELIRNHNDIYIALIACMASNENFWWSFAKRFADPLDHLDYCLELKDYPVLARQARDNSVAINSCTKRPCYHTTKRRFN